MSRIPNLDPARFLLAALVVVFHVPEISNTVGMPSWRGLPILTRGEEAVYGFFVLSGFLITYLLIMEKRKTRTVSIRQSTSAARSASGRCTSSSSASGCSTTT